MKKILVTALALMSSLMLFGCGSKEYVEGTASLNETSQVVAQEETKDETVSETKQEPEEAISEETSNEEVTEEVSEEAQEIVEAEAEEVTEEIIEEVYVNPDDWFINNGMSYSSTNTKEFSCIQCNLTKGGYIYEKTASNFEMPVTVKISEELLDNYKRVTVTYELDLTKWDEKYEYYFNDYAVFDRISGANLSLGYDIIHGDENIDYGMERNFTFNDDCTRGEDVYTFDFPKDYEDYVVVCRDCIASTSDDQDFASFDRYPDYKVTISSGDYLLLDYNYFK